MFSIIGRGPRVTATRMVSNRSPSTFPSEQKETPEALNAPDHLRLRGFGLLVFSSLVAWGEGDGANASWGVECFRDGREMSLGDSMTL